MIRNNFQSKLMMLVSVIAISTASLNAQQKDSAYIEHVNDNTVLHIYDGKDHTEVSISNMKVDVDHKGDTMSVITLGKRKIEVIENGSQTKVRVTRVDDSKFKGHYAGFQLGMTNLTTSGLSSNFSVDDQFMELNMGKSINVGINFMQYSIPLTARNNFGLVTGAGLNYSNYRFDNPYLIKHDAETGKTIGLLADDASKLEKSKLVTSFIQFPLLIEKQWNNPSDGKHKNGCYISAGGYFGLKTGSHTKVVYDGKKSKDHGNFNIRPYEYGLSFRMGCRWLDVFADYQLSSLFEDEKGPVCYPFTVGLMLMRF